MESSRDSRRDVQELTRLQFVECYLSVVGRFDAANSAYWRPTAASNTQERSPILDYSASLPAAVVVVVAVVPNAAFASHKFHGAPKIREAFPVDGIRRSVVASWWKVIQNLEN